MAEWPGLENAKVALGEEGVDEDEVLSTIGDLTFLEAKEFAERTGKLRQEQRPLKGAYEDARKRSTMNRAVDPDSKKKKKETWKERIKDQEEQIRGLDL